MKHSSPALGGLAGALPDLPPRPTTDEAAAYLSALIVRSRIADRLDGLAITRAAPGRIVARTRLDGADCYIKAYTHRAARRVTRAVEAEFVLASRNMGTGRFRIVDCLLADPALGLLVTSAAPGISIEDLLRSQDPRLRAETFEMAGRWLAAYVEGRRATRTFDPQRFLRRRKATLERPFYANRRAEGTLPGLDRFIATRAEALRGRRVDIAASHGDFISRNFHRHEEQITGFDIDDHGPTSLAKEVARFLIYQQARSPVPDRTLFGIDRTAVEAMRLSGVLDAEEWDRTVPLFIAQQLELRYTEMSMNPRARLNLETAAGRLLAEQA